MYSRPSQLFINKILQGSNSRSEQCIWGVPSIIVVVRSYGALNGPLHLQSDSAWQCELSQGTKQADNLIRTRIEVDQNLFSPI